MTANWVMRIEVIRWEGVTEPKSELTASRLFYREMLWNANLTKKNHYFEPPDEILAMSGKENKIFLELSTTH